MHCSTIPRRRNPAAVLGLVLLAGLAAAEGAARCAEGATFPEGSWETRPPAALGMDAELLEQLATLLGGRGCVVKDGYVVQAWGDQAHVADIYSAAKPVLGTLLFFAIEEGLVQGVDQPVADFGWPLTGKDRGITFRHLGAMTSGYARPEGPGEAWAYNDYAIQLYQMTLFDKVFREDAKAVAEDPRRLGPLGFEDGLRFSARRRISASVRDLARIAWFWANEGCWHDRQLLPRRVFADHRRPQVPAGLPVSREAPTDDVLGIKTYGGESSHFALCGPGVYGFNWWFNGTGWRHRENITWPDAPLDTFMAIGRSGNSAAMIPSLGLVLVAADASWSDLRAGDPGSRINQALGLVARAAGFRAEARPVVTGAMRKWQPVTITFTGPESAETATPNPFTDYRLDVLFSRGERTLSVPGFFAADGNAAETGSTGGRAWRVRFLPDEAGAWTFRARFRTGPGVAVASDPEAGTATAFDGLTGGFTIDHVDDTATGFHATGRLDYVGERYLRFAETGGPWLKGGADSPENLLAYADFDDTTPTHTYEPHVADARPVDPTWRDGRGKGLLGALNYLASKRMNSVYFLTMNVGGDGKDVWPWIADTEVTRFDVSKLDQWNIVFDHMDTLGIMMHVVHQEQENDQYLDGGRLGDARRLYYRELVARFAHHPVVVWNLGEENTNSDEERKAFARHLHELDPYDHPRVIHTYPSQVEEVYGPLLGFPFIEGPSFQFGKAERTHPETVAYLARARAAGRPWYACQDEIGPAQDCVPPDVQDPERAAIVRHALWGNLMAGGSGVEWIFAYDTWPRVKGKHLDIACETWRPWEKLWDHTAIALEFFHHELPFPEMESADELVSDGGGWCLAKPGEIYAVFVFGGESPTLRLPPGRFSRRWLDIRAGGPLLAADDVDGAAAVPLGRPPHDAEQDWVLLLTRRDGQ